MKKGPILCVFAHPDDEAFGPGGTIALLSKKNPIYLICVTDGNDPTASKNFKNIRKKELEKSADILGVKQVNFLDYKDGSLNNQVYHQISEQISKYVKRINPQIMLTFELRGISGHLDHVAVSMITSYAFENNPDVEELWYYCELQKVTDSIEDYFIFFPPGYLRKDIDKVVDVEEVWDKKLAAIRAHESQKKDGRMIIDMLKKRPKKEHFIIWKR